VVKGGTDYIIYQIIKVIRIPGDKSYERKCLANRKRKKKTNEGILWNLNERVHECIERPFSLSIK